MLFDFEAQYRSILIQTVKNWYKDGDTRQNMD